MFRAEPRKGPGCGCKIMKVTVHYMAQIRRAAGIASETVAMENGCNLADFLGQLAARHEPAFRNIVLDGTDKAHRSLLIFIGEEQVPADAIRMLTEGDVITLLTPMAGGRS